MFTGLIETSGHLFQRKPHAEGAVLKIELGEGWGSDDPVVVGESIAVNGVCLTVTGVDADSFSADVLKETLRCTTLGRLQIGAPLNLERALKADGRFGGHIVSGHVDGTARVLRIDALGRDYVVKVGCEPGLLEGMVCKGSVAVDGISLTIATLNESDFCVHIIPVTWTRTNIHALTEGDRVNIEIDILGKYVKKALQSHIQRPQPK